MQVFNNVIHLFQMKAQQKIYHEKNERKKFK